MANLEIGTSTFFYEQILKKIANVIFCAEVFNIYGLTYVSNSFFEDCKPNNLANNLAMNLNKL